jgi:hypothetical protein
MFIIIIASSQLIILYLLQTDSALLQFQPYDHAAILA